MHIMSSTSTGLHGTRPSRVRTFLRSCISALCSSSRQHDENDNSVLTSEKKYVHVPQHAAADFLRTSTSRQMRKNNEILV
ncbi:uncharacterized protein PG998_011307 [Apiospora kogelbergensis]|uniref:Uncharacterized protein n=1 Tax=Apiospora kogelbergensis TaxID=1337665 RepID=A0AAW0RCD0_9PEZI